MLADQIHRVVAGRSRARGTSGRLGRRVPVVTPDPDERPHPGLRGRLTKP
jgi:hypothetical protein